jgi:Domain of unknown function (DUF4360)
MPRSTVIASGIAFALLSASAALAQTPSGPPDHFTIEIVSVTGSGCGSPADYDINISSDLESFTIGYNNNAYSVATGRDPSTGKAHPIKDTRKNCLLGIRIDAPNGFTYGIAEADTRGFMSLRPYASPIALISFWFQGLAPTYPVAHYLRQSAVDLFGNPLSFAPGDDTGVFAVNWQTTDITPVASIVFNPCGEQRNLEVNTQLLINTQDVSHAESVAGVDATDGSIFTVFHTAWATCP